jgi:hypothetical protein
LHPAHKPSSSINTYHQAWSLWLSLLLLLQASSGMNPTWSRVRRGELRGCGKALEQSQLAPALGAAGALQLQFAASSSA